MSRRWSVSGFIFALGFLILPLFSQPLYSRNEAKTNLTGWDFLTNAVHLEANGEFFANALLTNSQWTNVFVNLGQYYHASGYAQVRSRLSLFDKMLSVGLGLDLENPNYSDLASSRVRVRLDLRAEKEWERFFLGLRVGDLEKLTLGSGLFYDRSPLEGITARLGWKDGFVFSALYAAHDEIVYDDMYNATFSWKKENWETGLSTVVLTTDCFEIKPSVFGWWKPFSFLKASAEFSPLDVAVGGPARGVHFFAQDLATNQGKTSLTYKLALEFSLSNQSRDLAVSLVHRSYPAWVNRTHYNDSTWAYRYTDMEDRRLDGWDSDYFYQGGVFSFDAEVRGSTELFWKWFRLEGRLELNFRRFDAIYPFSILYDFGPSFRIGRYAAFRFRLRNYAFRLDIDSEKWSSLGIAAYNNGKSTSPITPQDIEDRYPWNFFSLPFLHLDFVWKL